MGGRELDACRDRHRVRRSLATPPLADAVLHWCRRGTPFPAGRLLSSARTAASEDRRFLSVGKGQTGRRFSSTPSSSRITSSQVSLEGGISPLARISSIPASACSIA